MVEPLEIHNMLGRTPLVEKTVAAHRDDAQQLQNQAAQIQRLREHADQKVELKRETARVEPDNSREHKTGEGRREGSGSEQPNASAGEAETIEWVQEAADEPEHKLDVTI